MSLVIHDVNIFIVLGYYYSRHGNSSADTNHIAGFLKQKMNYKVHTKTNVFN